MRKVLAVRVEEAAAVPGEVVENVCGHRPHAKERRRNSIWERGSKGRTDAPRGGSTTMFQ